MERTSSINASNELLDTPVLTQQTQPSQDSEEGNANMIFLKQEDEEEETPSQQQRKPLLVEITKEYCSSYSFADLKESHFLTYLADHKVKQTRKKCLETLRVVLQDYWPRSPMMKSLREQMERTLIFCSELQNRDLRSPYSRAYTPVSGESISPQNSGALHSITRTTSFNNMTEHFMHMVPQLPESSQIQVNFHYHESVDNNQRNTPPGVNFPNASQTLPNYQQNPYQLNYPPPIIVLPQYPPPQNYQQNFESQQIPPKYSAQNAPSSYYPNFPNYNPSPNIWQNSVPFPRNVPDVCQQTPPMSNVQQNPPNNSNASQTKENILYPENQRSIYALLPDKHLVRVDISPTELVADLRTQLRLKYLEKHPHLASSLTLHKFRLYLREEGGDQIIVVDRIQDVIPEGALVFCHVDPLDDENVNNGG